MKTTIETTADGSATLYREDIDEHYHSVKGALAESEHIYAGLGWKSASENKNDIKVFEVGFGTGLNAALTAFEATMAQIHTKYYSVELYPLSQDIIQQLLPFQTDSYKDLFIKINEAEWDKEIEITPYFTLVKIQQNLLTMDIPKGIDVVYFDAFAPEKQPEMWGDGVFGKIYESMNIGGVLTTYCAKGVIRRLLGEIGFVTERMPGPPGGKREVLRARKRC